MRLLSIIFDFNLLRDTFTSLKTRLSLDTAETNEFPSGKAEHYPKQLYLSTEITANI